MQNWMLMLGMGCSATWGNVYSCGWHIWRASLLSKFDGRLWKDVRFVIGICCHLCGRVQSYCQVIETHDYHTCMIIVGLVVTSYEKVLQGRVAQTLL